jgi:hypothetical protein
VSVDVELKLDFADNEAAQQFIFWLKSNGYGNFTSSGSILTVNLVAHGDRVAVLEEARRQKVKVIADKVTDDY